MPSQSFSGKNGKVQINSVDIVDTCNWNIKEDAGIQSYASNATAGWEKQVDGIHKWSGDFKMLPQGGAPPIVIGTSYPSKFYENAAQFWSGSSP